MSRYLFVTAPHTGHVTPMVAVSVELRARGHAVEWLAHEQVGQLLEGESVQWLPAEQAEDAVNNAIHQRPGVAGFARNIDIEYDLAEAMMAMTETTIARFRPQVVLTDWLMTAGSIAARRAGIPWATSYATNEVPEALRPKYSGVRILERLDEHRADFERRWGLAPSPCRDSTALTLAYTVPELVNPHATRHPPGLCFVGPVRPLAQQAQVPFPWERLDDRPLVYVALGTLLAYRGARFYRAVLDGLSRLHVQVVISAPDGVVAPPWGDAIVVPFAPQSDLIARSQVMIGHGGMTSTWECLRLGVPMVIAPGLNDQMGMAQRIDDLGAGLRISFARATPPVIADAVQQVLGETSFAAEARRLGDAGLARGGERRAADALEALAQQAP